MARLIDDDWCWRCGGCGNKLAFSGFVPSQRMLQEYGWNFCPHCGTRIDYDEVLVEPEEIWEAEETWQD